MEFYSTKLQQVLGPVLMLPHSDAFLGEGKLPMNSFAILRPHGSILFDAPFSWVMDAIEDLIGLGYPPLALVLSHQHLANAGDAFHQIAEHYEVPFLLLPADQGQKASGQANITFDDPTTGQGAQILRDAAVQVIHISGQSPSSIMLYIADEGGILLSGDTIVSPDCERASLERPLHRKASPCRIVAWKKLLGRLPIAAILPLRGAFCLRDEVGDASFDAAVTNILTGNTQGASKQ